MIFKKAFFMTTTFYKHINEFIIEIIYKFLMIFIIVLHILALQLIFFDYYFFKTFVFYNLHFMLFLVFLIILDIYLFLLSKKGLF